MSVSFVNRIAGLESLTMILGGREDIDEIAHDGLRELEVVRVRGLERLEPERFGRLERLLVEDQIQLGGLRFGRTPSLSHLRILNCKTFDRLEGLARLEGLDEIRVSRTNLDLEKLIEAGLPPRLRVFAFYTGKARENARARKRLDELGYVESRSG
jgi:protein phosphatase 1 regulatory subunit 7